MSYAKYWMTEMLKTWKVGDVGDGWVSDRQCVSTVWVDKGLKGWGKPWSNAEHQTAKI